MSKTVVYIIDGERYEAKIAEGAKWITFPDQEPSGKNRPCPCGSGKKFKLCCMNKGTN